MRVERIKCFIFIVYTNVKEKKNTMAKRKYGMGANDTTLSFIILTYFTITCITNGANDNPQKKNRY